MVEQVGADEVANGDSEFLVALDAAAVASGGTLGFDRFMEMALYDSRFGYYTRRRQRVGRDGDFVTSVSVGRCFGMLLARHLAPVLERMAEAGGGELLVVEPGAEGGELAVDVMRELEAVLEERVWRRVRYVAVEPFAAKRGELRCRLAEVGAAEVVADWGELGGGARGVLIANEVLDAMPVRRFRFVKRCWWELGVEVVDGRCREVRRALADGEGVGLPEGLSEGFTVERNEGLARWFAEIGAAFESVYGLFIDYGLERTAMFYDPGRAAGTLRAYRHHRLLEDVLAAPGETDLTAHVDFERAATAARAAGFEVCPLADQHRFLVNAARPWLLEIEARGGPPDAATAKLLRQFQSLSHPAAMGTSFKVMSMILPANERE